MGHHLHVTLQQWCICMQTTYTLVFEVAKLPWIEGDRKRERERDRVTERERERNRETEREERNIERERNRAIFGLIRDNSFWSARLPHVCTGCYFSVPSLYYIEYYWQWCCEAVAVVGNPFCGWCTLFSLRCPDDFVWSNLGTYVMAFCSIGAKGLCSDQVIRLEWCATVYITNIRFHLVGIHTFV